MSRASPSKAIASSSRASADALFANSPRATSLRGPKRTPREVFARANSSRASASRSSLSNTWSDPTAELAPSARRGIWGPWRWLAWLVASAVLSLVVVAPLDLWSQTLFGATIFGVAFLVSRFAGRIVTLTLVIISVTVSLRYLYWRATTTVGADHGVDMALGIVLFMAEIYAVLVLILGYVQTAWPLRRKPVALPEDTSLWPTVDVYIPTYNEPLAVVRTTVLAAKALDWPADKINVYVLDDGRREAFRRFAAEAGVGYIIRPDNKHAKAGNINHAMKQTRGDLVAIFDCDHIPTRSFLQLTVGWFLRDKKLAMVQTPHHFYTPDPFERNLGNFKKIPNEGELFYGVLQKGNDLWNASFFCGSCAVIRRVALEQVGGIAPETVTEDAHTMLKLHRRGWRSAYLDAPQAAGLATETLSGHIGQRIRWARGMAQIFRIDNPLLGRGLNLVQRLCYASAMLHFFYGIPRVIFLMAPLAYLLFDAHIFNASAETILAFALPHMAHAYLTNARIQGAHRHSFWAEVYEATLATYIIYPTTLALISPKLGKFNVTAKGGISEKGYFDLKIALPYLLMTALNLTGTTFGVVKLVGDHAETGVILVNLVWSAYAFLILAATLAVVWERPQRRTMPRVDAKLPIMVRLPDQKLFAAETVDLSLSGMAFTLPEEVSGLQKDDVVEVAFVGGTAADFGEQPAEAQVVQRHGRTLQVRFTSLPLAAEEGLTRAVFGRPSAWLDWKKGRKHDRPIRSLLAVLAHGVAGAARIPRIFSARRTGTALALVGASAAAIGLAGLGAGKAHAELPAGPGTSWSLAHLGLDAGTQTYHRRASLRLPFFARGDQVFTAAELALDFDPALAPAGVDTLRVSMNDEPIATLPIASLPKHTTIAIAPQLLEEKNALVFDLVRSDDGACPDLVALGSWRFVRGGQLETRAASLPLPDDVSMLPLPFFDPSADALVPIPIVFPSVPDAELVRIGGFVASYFGLRAGARFAFPVSYGTLPTGHAVVLVTPADTALVAALGPQIGADLKALGGPMVAMRPNPASPNGSAKLLVVAGRDRAELERAALRLALDFDATKQHAATVAFDAWLPPLTPHVPYDAPRWRPVDRPVLLGDLATPTEREFKGALGGTIAVELRIPPDVFVWPKTSVDLDLKWRARVPALGVRPELAVEVNGHYLASLAVVAGDDGAGDGDGEIQSRRLRIPIADLRGYNRLLVHVVPPSDACPRPDRDTVEVELLAESALHLEGHPSFKPMPDLESFVADGFPFTRMADLSESALVLPASPLPEEVASALSVIAQTTAVTGVPALGLTIAFDGAPGFGAAALGDKDLLVVGVAARLPLIATPEWVKAMPVEGFATGGLSAPEKSIFERGLAWTRGEPLGEELRRLGRAVQSSVGALVMGFAAPHGRGRSVVVVTAASPAEMPSLATFQGETEAIQAHADVLVQANGKLAAFRIGSGYGAGDLPPIKAASWFLARYWVVLVPALMVVAWAFAWVLRRRLANLEYRRLSFEDRA